MLVAFGNLAINPQHVAAVEAVNHGYAHRNDPNVNVSLANGNQIAFHHDGGADAVIAALNTAQLIDDLDAAQAGKQE